MAEKEKSQKRGRKKLELSPLAIIDNIVFNKNDRWAFYQISNQVYDFLSNDAKISFAVGINNAFAGIMGERTEPLEMTIISSSVPYDIEKWRDQIETESDGWDHGPGFEDYMSFEEFFLKRSEYSRKVTYLGVNLGRRGSFDVTSFIDAGITAFYESMKKWMNSLTFVPNEIISPNEEKEARNVEKMMYTTLSTGNLAAERCTAQELLLLIKRQFFPAMPVPYLDVDPGNRLGPGDLALESTSCIKNKLRWLEINQMIGEKEHTGYRAVLTISKLPKDRYFPYNVPFMYLTSMLNLENTSYIRFKLHPPEKMKKELEKKKKESKDELENMAAATSNLDSSVGLVSETVSENLSDLQRLNSILSSDKTPWVEGTYRIVVECETEEELKHKCSKLKQSYADQDITLSWTVGDQAKLFLEQMPGDKIRESSNMQITNLLMLSTSGFLYTSEVGDPIQGT